MFCTNMTNISVPFHVVRRMAVSMLQYLDELRVKALKYSEWASTNSVRFILLLKDYGDTIKLLGHRLSILGYKEHLVEQCTTCRTHLAECAQPCSTVLKYFQTKGTNIQLEDLTNN